MSGLKPTEVQDVQNVDVAIIRHSIFRLLVCVHSECSPQHIEKRAQEIYYGGLAEEVADMKKKGLVQLAATVESIPPFRFRVASDPVIRCEKFPERLHYFLDFCS